MKKNYLGSTGILVSKLGLGTVKLGRNTGVKYPKPFELPSDAEALNLLARAQELGINLLDTAPAYGQSEERLGKLLKLAQNRSQWVLMTKAGEIFENNESSFDFSPEFLEASLKSSLKKLGTDYIDIFLIHSNGEDEKIIQEGALEQLQDFKKRGLIRACGMSSKTVQGGILALEQSDLAMITLNINYTAEMPVIEKAKALNKGIVLKKALGGGHVQDLEQAFKFLSPIEPIHSIIIGTINPKHLTDNVNYWERLGE
ncbi:MAG: aldo/keto reductase [Gammaproteobacteria bacterium]